MQVVTCYSFSVIVHTNGNFHDAWCETFFVFLTVFKLITFFNDYNLCRWNISVCLDD